MSVGQTFTGGCLCGAVRYEARGQPVFAGHCHCRDCQRATGAGHASYMGMPRQQVKVSGETRMFSILADSGLPANRLFCPTCGSQIMAADSATPDIITIFAGTLDDTSLFNPQAAIYVRSRPHWDRTIHALPEFEAAPPRGTNGV